MSSQSNPVSVVFRRAALALTILFFAVPDGNAQSATKQGSAERGPFGQLAGSWSGSGTINLSSGKHEPIKCRASYDVLDEENKLQLNIHCASESYKFDLRASATYGAVQSQGVGVNPHAMLPAPCPARSKALAFRSWPRDRHLPPI